MTIVEKHVPLLVVLTHTPMSMLLPWWITSVGCWASKPSTPPSLVINTW